MIRQERATHKSADTRSQRREKSSSSQTHPVLVSDNDQMSSDAETDAEGDGSLEGETADPQLSHQDAKKRYAELCACAVACYIDQNKDTVYSSATTLALDVLRQYDYHMLTSKGVVTRNAAQTVGVMQRHVDQRIRARSHQKRNTGGLTIMDFVRQGSEFLVPDVFSREHYDMLLTQLTSKQQTTVSGIASKSKQESDGAVLSVPDCPTSDNDIVDAGADAAGPPPHMERTTSSASLFSRASPYVSVTERPGIGPAFNANSEPAQSEVSNSSTTLAQTMERPPPVRDMHAQKRQGSETLEPPKLQKKQRSGKMPGQEGTRASSSYATYVPFDDTEFSLEDKKISFQMHDLFVCVKSIVCEGLDDMGIDDSASALWSFSVSPVDTLHRLYSTLLGPGMVNDRRDLIAHTMTVADLTIALIGAFFKLEVFEQSRLTTADTWLSSVTGAIGDLAPCVDRELSRRSNTNIDTILRRAYFAWVEDLEVQQQKLAPVADHLALTLGQALHHHLRQHRHDDVTNQAADQRVVISWARRLEQIILRGLALQCQLSSARETYHFRWHNVTEGNDRRTMAATHGQGHKVVATLFPGLEIDTSNGTRVVYKMQAHLE